MISVFSLVASLGSYMSRITHMTTYGTSLSCRRAAEDSLNLSVEVTKPWASPWAALSRFYPKARVVLTLGQQSEFTDKEEDGSRATVCILRFDTITSRHMVINLLDICDITYFPKPSRIPRPAVGSHARKAFRSILLCRHDVKVDFYWTIACIDSPSGDQWTTSLGIPNY